MSKRPPLRHATRETAAPVLDTRLSAANLDMAPGSQADAAPVGQDDAGDVPAARNRDELVALLGDLRQQGSLDVADEAAILREYDALLADLHVEKAKLEAEFNRRLAQDGREETDAWLAGAAEALGRRQGEQMRRLMKTIPAVAAQLQMR